MPRLATVAVLLLAALAFAEDVGPLLDAGNEKFNKGDYDGALVYYERAIATDPRDARAWFNRGLAKAAKGDAAGAVADYTKAIEINPKHAKAYFSRGYVRNNRGDLAGAIADYTKSIEIDPRDAESFAYRGLAKRDKGDADGAIADETKALELNPKYTWAWSLRGLARQAKRDFDGAVEDFSHAIELDATFAAAYANRCDARLKTGDFDGAVEDGTRAIELEPKEVHAYLDRGTALYATGETKAALADFDKAFAIDPRHEAAHQSSLAGAAELGGDVERAAEALARSIELGNDDGNTWFHRARLAFHSGEKGTQALADLRKALSLETSQRDYVRLWIWLVRADLGKREAADEELRDHLVDRKPLGPDEWYVKVARFLTGSLSEEALLAAAQSPDARTRRDRECEACFYAGAARALRGEPARAIELMDRCIATDVRDYIEFEAAIGCRRALLVGAKVAALPGVVRASQGVKGDAFQFTEAKAKGPAVEAGLQPDDVVTAVDGEAVGATRMRKILDAAHVGAVLHLDVLRQGQPSKVEVVLGVWK